MTSPDVEKISYEQAIRNPPVEIDCSTLWVRPASVDGIQVGVTVHILTKHSFNQQLRENSQSTQTSTNLPTPRLSEPTDVLDHNLLFELHKDVFHSTSSDQYEDAMDLSQRTTLSAFLLSDNCNQVAPLKYVRVFAEHHRYNQATDQKNMSSSFQTPRLTNIVPSAACVQLNLSEYRKIKRSTLPKAQFPKDHTVYVALGSNVGNRMYLIEQACKSMEARGIKLVRTSALYETAPMYFEDQPPFLNGACQVDGLIVLQRRYHLDTDMPVSLG